jgi:hypothetical protein
VKAKKLYSFFYLAVLMFVAKPFIGFSISGMNSAAIIESHSLLAKSFTNRRPDDLEDSKAKSGAIHQQLTNPPLPLLLTITALLSLLFPLLFKRADRTGNSFINELKTALVPAAQPYLLTGKLTI